MRSLSRSRGRKSCRLSRAEKRREEEAIQVLLYYYLLLIHYCSLMYYYCVLLAGLVIQDQTSSNLNSLDTKVHHKDEQQTSKQEIGPYFGFGVSSATTKSTLSLFFTVGLLMMHWKFFSSPMAQSTKFYQSWQTAFGIYPPFSFSMIFFLNFPILKKKYSPPKNAAVSLFYEETTLEGKKRKRWKKHLCVCSSLCSLGNYAKLPLIELQPHIEEKL